MSNLEGVAPDSLEAQAIAELQTEGNVITEHQPVNDDGEILDKKVEATVETPVIPKEEPEVETPSRTPSMVEAWKLKVAEDQKDSAIKQAQELQAKIEELSKQKSPVTETQRVELSDEIKTLAEESGVDENFLNKFADTILKKAKPSEDISKIVQSLTEERELVKQENLYSQEFAKDIEPLVKEQYGLSDTALSQLKTQLKDLAFSETYAKVPLSKILKAEFDTLGIKEPKRSSEGKAIKVRSNEVVDFDNLTEEQFEALSPEKLEEFSKRSSSGWHIPKK